MSGRDVFVNCSFSPDYQIHFQAIVFTIVRSARLNRGDRLAKSIAGFNLFKPLQQLFHPTGG